VQSYSNSDRISELVGVLCERMEYAQTAEALSVELRRFESVRTLIGLILRDLINASDRVDAAKIAADLAGALRMAAEKYDHCLADALTEKNDEQITPAREFGESRV